MTFIADNLGDVADFFKAIARTKREEASDAKPRTRDQLLTIAMTWEDAAHFLCEVQWSKQFVDSITESHRNEN